MPAEPRPPQEETRGPTSSPSERTPVAHDVLDAIRFTINAIRSGERKSRHANLTITSLEQAELWWMRELGFV